MPAWLVPGVTVNYHPRIGGPSAGMFTVRAGPAVLASGETVVWLSGKGACVSIRAVSLAVPEGSGRSLPTIALTGRGSG